jgi:hypothetical protein
MIFSRDASRFSYLYEVDPNFRLPSHFRVIIVLEDDYQDEKTLQRLPPEWHGQGFLPSEVAHSYALPNCENAFSNMCAVQSAIFEETAWSQALSYCW